jgi:hypothetical protein
MTNAVDAALKQLASISHTLNEVSDQLSKHLVEVESALSAYKLGVSAWVELRKEKELSEPDNDGRRYEFTYVEMLGYGKYKGKWGLLAASYCEETFEGEFDQQHFLRDAPRETRLAAVEKLPNLLTALTKEAAQVAEEAAKKAEEARQIATGLGKKTR